VIHGEVREVFSGLFEQEIQFDSQHKKNSSFGDHENQDSHEIPTLHINTRYLPTKSFLEKLRSWIQRPEIPTEFIHEHQGQRIVVASGKTAIKDQSDREFQPKKVEIVLNDVEWIEYPWNILEKNGEEIKRDIARLISVKSEHDESWDILPGIQSGFNTNAFIDDPSTLYMHPTAIVEPGVTMQTSEGPIIVGAGARIMAGSHLKGPLAIGEGTIVKMGALLYKNSTIGPHCKVGGEVSNCIFHSFSNKAHHGYAGNSIFGQWVNLGAGTTTSNLRGNYGEVRIRDWVSGKDISTGRQFLGSIMGDHVKTGINTILNTGTVVGPSSMIFGAGFAPKWIDAFSWINSDTGEATVYDIEKSLVDMQRMMARRELTLSESYASLMRALSHKRNK
jgi:UDP-N-acetylglucosamine diphosphorylase/glucosamine-1-phosphate N-acetyltransferase